MTEAQFEKFVRETHGKALSLSVSYLGDWEEARDAVQEAYIKAYKNRSFLRGEAAVSTWYYRILVNHLKDRLRRRKFRDFFHSLLHGDGEEAAQVIDPGRGPDGEAEATALKRTLKRAVDSLPRRQQEVFRLKSLTELTFVEISGILGISDGAAKTHYSRAVTELKTALAAWREA